MVRRADRVPSEYVAPQAILWRPLRYFSHVVMRAEDDLDTFEYVAFDIGNECSFDLRNYAGHERFVATVYLSLDTADWEIDIHIERVIEALAVPSSAIAWRRGMNFEFGKLRRPKNDRLREREARVLALKIASTFPKRAISTEELKAQIPEVYQLSAIDLEPSGSRPHEQKWQQIVGNVISHRDTEKGPFQLGYAERTPDGLSVTNAGLNYLKSIGFA